MGQSKYDHSNSVLKEKKKIIMHSHEQFSVLFFAFILGYIDSKCRHSTYSVFNAGTLLRLLLCPVPLKKKTID